MVKRKMIWVVGAVILATMAALVGCADDRGSAAAGQGPAWRLSMESDQGQGRRTSSQSLPAPESTSTVGSRGGGGKGRDTESLPSFAAAGQQEARGEVVTISGTLLEGDDHWTLDTESGVYQLGFGRPDYLNSTGMVLAEGAAAEIRGFIEEDGEISVVTCGIDGQQYTFRTEEGTPLWAGGYRAQSATADDAPRGRGSGGGRGRSS